MVQAAQREARPARLVMVALVSLGLLARLAPAFMMPPDAAARLPGAPVYFVLARSLAEGRGFVLTETVQGGPVPGADPVAEPAVAADKDEAAVQRAPVMPAYPLLLAIGCGLDDAPLRATLVIQAVCGTVAMVLAAWMAHRLAGAWAAVVAAALLAFDPLGVLFAALVSPVTLAAVALAAASVTGLAAVQAVRTGRRAWPWVLGAGAAQAAAAYVAVWTLAVLPVAVVAALASQHRRRLVTAWGLATAIVVVALAPWLVRNAGQGDEPAPVTDVGAGVIAAKEGKQEPGEPARPEAGAVRRAGRVWSPALPPGIENGPLHPAAGYTSLLPVVLLAVVGLWALRRQAEAWWLLVPAVAITFWQAAVGGWPGERAAVVAPLAALAGAGLVALLGKSGGAAEPARK